MSHFPVLVIGNNPAALLAPYHEFECTGYDDEYVQEIDETEEYRKSYESNTKKALVSPDGEAFDYYDERFYTKEPDEETRIKAALSSEEKMHEVPEGWETREDYPVKDLVTFTEFVRICQGTVDGERPWELRPGQEKTESHKFQFTELNEKGEIVRIVKRTNPNKKWDFWVLGGRFGRFFKLKPEVELDLDNVGGGSMHTPEDGISERPEHYESPFIKKLRREWVEKVTAAHAVDHVQVKDVDFEGTRARAEKRARESFAQWREIYEKYGKPLPFEHFTELEKVAVKALEAQGIAEEQVKSLFFDYKVSRRTQERQRAQMNFNNQGAIEAARHLCGSRMTPMDWFGYDEEAFVEKLRRKELVPYAVVKDGEWFALGNMGWFATSNDLMTEDEWIDQVNAIYENLDPETWLTLVDCHI